MVDNPLLFVFFIRGEGRILVHRIKVDVFVIEVVVNVLALSSALVLGRLFELDASTTAGMLAGALTSAPTFAAASEVAPDGTALAVAFALAYPFGLVGIVLAVKDKDNTVTIRSDETKLEVLKSAVTSSIRKSDEKPEKEAAKA